MDKLITDEEFENQTSTSRLNNKSGGLESHVENEVSLPESFKIMVLSHLKGVIEDKNCVDFVDRVDEKVVADYPFIIQVPMELNLIKKRLENNYYRTFDSLKFDVDLIYNNCIKYNLPGAPITIAASNLHKQLHKSIKLCMKETRNGNNIDNTTLNLRLRVPKSCKVNEKHKEDIEKTSTSNGERGRRKSTNSSTATTRRSSRLSRNNSSILVVQNESENESECSLYSGSGFSSVTEAEAERKVKKQKPKRRSSRHQNKRNENEGTAIIQPLRRSSRSSNSRIDYCYD